MTHEELEKELQLSNLPYFKEISNMPDSFLNRVFIPDGNFFTKKRPFAYEKPMVWKRKFRNLPIDK